MNLMFNISLLMEQIWQDYVYSENEEEADRLIAQYNRLVELKDALCETSNLHKRGGVE